MAAHQGRGTAATGVNTVVMMLVLGSLCASKAVMAANYVVGDADQWTIMSYDSWVAGKTFKVGDTLEFKYSRSHDVVEVSKANYDACAEGSNTVYTNGDTTFTLTEEGAKYYICSVSDHCASGMKLAINVVAASTTPPTSSPTPTTPVTPTSSPTPTTPTTPTTPSTPNTTTTPSPPNSSPLSLPPSILMMFLILGLSILFFQF